jgi:hypothetical protein
VSKPMPKRIPSGYIFHGLVQISSGICL